MSRALLPVGFMLAVIVVAVVLTGCPSSAPKSQESPQEIPSGQGAVEPSGTVNAEAKPTSNTEATNAQTSAGTEPAVGDGKTLAETKCSKCHGFDKATAEKRDAAGWDRVVQTMAAKKPGWISDSEAARIKEYLAANFAP